MSQMSFRGLETFLWNDGIQKSGKNEIKNTQLLLISEIFALSWWVLGTIDTLLTFNYTIFIHHNMSQNNFKGFKGPSKLMEAKWQVKIKQNTHTQLISQHIFTFLSGLRVHLMPW